MFVKVDVVGLRSGLRKTWLVGKLDGLQVSKSYGPRWGIAGVVWWPWRNYGAMWRGGMVFFKILGQGVFPKKAFLVVL